jgi:hypothetical protein
MPELSIQNIERISRDVKRQEIIFSHLADDLIDHICCDVENAMEDGLTFYEAYMKVKQKMNPRRLKEIQEETLYSIDTKYRNMKNTMKTSGVAGTVVYGLAALFKIQHWPGAGIMLTLGALILVFVFMPAALGVLWKETRSSKKVVLFISAFLSAGFFITGILFKIQHWNGGSVILILTGITTLFLLIPSLLAAVFRDPESKPERPVITLASIGLMAYFTGFLFKIMHWPGSGLLLIGGLLLIFLIVLPWYTWMKWKDEKSIRAEFLFLIAGSLAILLPSALLNLNLQRSYDEGFYYNLEEQQSLNKYFRQNKNAFLAFYHDSSSYSIMQQLDARTGDLMEVITSVEEKMICESEGEPGNPVENPSQIKQTGNGTEIEFRLLSYPFHKSPVRDFLMTGSESRSMLEQAIREYKLYLSTIISTNIFEEIDKMIDPSKYLPLPGSENRRISMISGLHSLAVMKNSLLTAEIHALRHLKTVE